MFAMAFSLALSAIPVDKATHFGVGALVGQIATKGLCAAGSNLDPGRGVLDQHRRCRVGDLIFGAVAGMLASLMKEQYDQTYGHGADNGDALAGTLGAAVGAMLVIEW